MSPYEIISNKYSENPQAQTLDWYIRWHCLHGFVYVTPSFFLMARPVVRDAPACRITEPTYLFNHADCDCWYIHAMAGDIRGAINMEPFKLPWYSWERVLDGKLDLRFYKSERIRTLSKALIP